MKVQEKEPRSPPKQSKKGRSFQNLPYKTPKLTPKKKCL